MMVSQHIVDTEQYYKGEEDMKEDLDIPVWYKHFLLDHLSSSRLALDTEALPAEATK
jgi:hypothetical protein